jgi:hypothetical protein
MLTLANNVSTGRSATYAAGTDFCRIFTQDMKSLYLLALLMTGDGEKAGECFALALEDSTKSNRIFKDWAPSWARRMVIQNAIRIVEPATDPKREGASLRTIDTGVEMNAKGEAPLGAILSLASFERCVFVMSVLERYSDQDCAVLLECSRRDIAVAKVRAAQHIASFAKPPATRGASHGTDLLIPGHFLPATA